MGSTALGLMIRASIFGGYGVALHWQYEVEVDPDEVDSNSARRSGSRLARSLDRRGDSAKWSVADVNATLPLAMIWTMHDPRPANRLYAFAFPDLSLLSPRLRLPLHLLRADLLLLCPLAHPLKVRLSECHPPIRLLRAGTHTSTCTVTRLQPRPCSALESPPEPADPSFLDALAQTALLRSGRPEGVVGHIPSETEDGRRGRGGV